MEETLQVPSSVGFERSESVVVSVWSLLFLATTANVGTVLQRQNFATELIVRHDLGINPYQLASKRIAEHSAPNNKTGSANNLLRTESNVIE